MFEHLGWDSVNKDFGSLDIRLHQSVFDHLKPKLAFQKRKHEGHIYDVPTHLFVLDIYTVFVGLSQGKYHTSRGLRVYCCCFDGYLITF